MRSLTPHDILVFPGQFINFTAKLNLFVPLFYTNIFLSERQRLKLMTTNYGALATAPHQMNHYTSET
jgi:hypothetical protein